MENIMNYTTQERKRALLDVTRNNDVWEFIYKDSPCRISCGAEGGIVLEEQGTRKVFYSMRGILAYMDATWIYADYLRVG